MAIDTFERMQIANASLILSQILNPASRTGAGKRHRIPDRLAIARAIRANMIEHERVLPFLPSANPGWRIVLELYIAGCERSRLSVSDIWHMTNIAGATSLRWLKLLEDKGLVARSPDPADKRRIWLHLTEEGNHAVTSVVEDLIARLVPVVDYALAL